MGPIGVMVSGSEAPGQRLLFGGLALLADALERRGIRLLVNEFPRPGIPFSPAVVLGVVGLAAVADGAVAVTVALGGIGSHGLHFSTEY